MTHTHTHTPYILIVALNGFTVVALVCVVFVRLAKPPPAAGPRPLCLGKSDGSLGAANKAAAAAGQCF